METTRVIPVLCLIWIGGFAAGCTAADVTPDTPIEDLPMFSLEEELRIGSMEDPDIGFTRIGDVWVSPTGEVYVSEARELEVRAYHADGRLLRTYGREGEGPGEFRSIQGFGVVGDTLWISDSRLNRTTLFSLDGALLETVTAVLQVPIGEEMGFPLTVPVFPHALRSDGLIESMFVGRIYPNLPDSVAEVPRVLFDRDGRVVDTLEMVQTRVSRPAQVLQFGNRTSYVYLDPPAPDSGTYEVELDSGTFAIRWFVDGEPATGALRVVRRGPSGDTLFQEALRYDPRRVSSSYLDSLAASRARGSQTGRDSVRLFNAYRSATQLPEYHRPVRLPNAVGNGVVWTKLDPDDRDGNQWLFFLEQEEMLGVLDLPPGATVKWTDGGQIWLAQRDSFDVPWLVNYRIVTPRTR